MHRSYKLFISVGLLVVIFHTVVGKQLSRCDVVKQLKAHGITSNLGDWVCIADNESNRKTEAINKINTDGSWDYGIFQINSQYWCSKGKKGGDCNIRCEDLINDNIGDDIECIKKIHKRHGFSAWVAWVNKCKGKSLPDVSKC